MKIFLKPNVTYLIITFVSLALIMYFTLLVFKYPLLGIEVKKSEDYWVVEKIYDKGWAFQKNIHKGDIVKLVNGIEAGRFKTISSYNRVEKAVSITIIDENSVTKTFHISYDGLNSQFVFYLMLPFLFAVSSLILSLFLYYRKKEETSALVLGYFLVSLGLCYLSASASARGDLTGRIVTTVTFSGSLILFIHFLKSYLSRYKFEFINSSRIKLLYIIYILEITFFISVSFIHGSEQIYTKLELVIFLLLLFYTLWLLFWFNYRYKNIEGKNVLKILWIILISGFAPFITMYAIPNILFEKEIISAEVSAVFLLLIPLGFIYLQLVEKLFDIEFLINRLPYYLLLSVPFTIILSSVLLFYLKNRLFSYTSYFISLSIFLGTLLFLYIKEYIDYKIRHQIFFRKNNYDSNLFNFFQKAMNETKVSDFLFILMNEIRDTLELKEVYHAEILAKGEGAWLLENSDDTSPEIISELEAISWPHVKAGSLVEVEHGFLIIISESYYSKKIIFCGLKKYKTNLNIQDKRWLETIAYFSSILLENFQLIEGLVDKIENNKEGYPSWLSRLLFSLSEKERTNLSIDLHDTILQEQLQLLRDVEAIKNRTPNHRLKNDLETVKEKLLDNIHLIRETCNELRPPFLNELGIIQSIQNLVEQFRLKANFVIYTDLQNSLKKLEGEHELAIYRVIQELLNNAMKHSKASEVRISLKEAKQELRLVYLDNGVGIDMNKLKDSFKTMGLAGIKERISCIGGKIEIVSEPNKGLKVLIDLKVVGESVD